ncbi:MAG TPA: lytic murein transglycosylase B [Gammaproteobacteria bacterium]|nr:lytic murein transglycosylase B [Gammaproteobacteria bacterium]
MKLLSLFTAIVLVLAFTAPARAVDIQKPEVKAFIEHMVEKYQYPRPKLDKLLRETQISQKLIAALTHPAEAKPWYEYRAIFVRPARIKAGREFLAQQKKALAAAQAKYGVPPAVIASLVGMESFYGKHEGTHSALQALVTFAFGYPPREHFFRNELAQYLILCRKNGFNPTQLKSSYAGALGAGQFMPSSYLEYGVDVDGRGSDLFHSWDDITASIANYLARHGWRRGEPLAAPAAVPAGVDTRHLTGRTMKASQLHHLGVVFEAPVPGTAPVRLVKIKLRHKTRYWVGLPNFSVLMSYNYSPLYALAATQLTAAIDTSSAPSTAAESVAEKH